MSTDTSGDFGAGAAASYAVRARRLVPGLDALHRMTLVLLSEGNSADARILVGGAGGGMETQVFAAARPGWQFDGVDPSADMLAAARQTLGPLAARVHLHQGYVTEAPDGPFDGAACLLTLHFLSRPDRLRTLRGIRRRLRPGAALVVAHHSFPRGAADDDLWLRRYAAFATASGVEQTSADAARTQIAARLPVLSPGDDEDLLRAAGFSDIALFYAAFTFRGWVCRG